MNAQIPKLILAIGIAGTLGACASIGLGSSSPDRERIAQVHPGLSQDEVRSLVGAPGNVTGNARSGDALWIYSFTDTWGYPSELDVTFGTDGLVADTHTERLGD